MEEIWKDVEGYEGLYQISNLGRVKSFLGKGSSKSGGKETMLNPYKQKMLKGYYRLVVKLKKNGTSKDMKVHQLVAKAFIENPLNRLTVNHLDGNTSNNTVSNLEWCTQGENVRHAIETGLKKVYKFDKAELTELYSRFGLVKLAEYYGTSTTPILAAINKYGIEKRKQASPIIYHLTAPFLLHELKTKTQTQLAKEIGCDQSLISHYMKRIREGGTI